MASKDWKIRFIEARKSFGKSSPVLCGLNLKVSAGTVYALLGASGCGKTTALSAAVARVGLDSGSAELDGSSTSSLGYMPQELALHLELSARETLEYFARLHGIDNETAKKSSAFLFNLLNLSDSQLDTPVSNLSGGQQRRVSFASALVHSPSILVLDEPTVGADPRLRATIWSHLSLLAREGAAVIMTTHYLNEAEGRADKVGMMRGGKLLAEGTPSEIRSIAGDALSLEEAFIKLCTDESDEKTNNNRDNASISKMLAVKWNSKVHPVVYSEGVECVSIEQKADEDRNQNVISEASGRKSPSYSKCQFSPSRVWALIWKNFTKMRRNLSQLLFIFMMPAIQVIFFCLAIGGDPKDLRFAFVNLETNNCASTSPSQSGPSNNKSSCDLNNFSCRILDSLFKNDSETLIRTEFQSVSDAENALLNGDVWGMLVVPANFSDEFVDSLVSGSNLSRIEITLDQSNQQIAYTLQRSLKDGMDAFLSDLSSDCQFMGSLDGPSQSMTLVHPPVYGEEEPNFVHFIAPGIIILIVFFLALALTGELFILEKMSGTMARARAAGVAPAEVMAAHLTTQFVVLVGQAAITLICILVVFEIPCRGSVAVLVLLTLLQGANGMCYGLFLSACFDDLVTAMQACLGSFYPALLLSGVLWPTEGMPRWLRAPSEWLPSAAACTAMRDVMSRGWGLERPSVLTGVGVSFGWMVLFIVLGIVVLRVRSG